MQKTNGFDTKPLLQFAAEQGFYPTDDQVHNYVAKQYGFASPALMRRDEKMAEKLEPDTTTVSPVSTICE